jgi:5'-nucleotidase
VNYSWSQSAPIGSKISGITINGTPVDPAASYRITVNNFLADGGDGFVELRNATDRVGGDVDLDSFADYLAAHPNTAPPATNRITSVA